MFSSRSLIACVMFGAFGCATADQGASAPPADPVGQASAVQTFKRTTAAHLSQVLTDASARDALVSQLRQRSPIALSELTSIVGTIDTSALSSDLVPEVSLVDAAGDAANLLVAYSPAGSERTWTAIPGFQLGGAGVTLDAQQAPDAPVVVVQTNGKLTMRKAIDDANAMLQRAGLQQTPAATQSATAIPTHRLDSIRLKNDQEPWLLGAAEIYAIVSGVVGSNSPQMTIVDMPYLDNDGTTYTPHQIVIDWSGFQYQVANVQLFEHDSNTSYKDLISAIISAVGAVGSLAGYPVVQAVTEIANRIISAIPDSVFTNDDDYVDSFYTIEETKSYSGYVGAAGNATITMVPFLVQPN